MTGKEATTGSRTCFIAAAAGAPLAALHDALRARGVRILVPEALTVGADIASQTRTPIAQASFVIGVIASKRDSPWVYFQLGQAWAHSRLVILIASPKLGELPSTANSLVVLRIDPSNRQAIDFALDQLLAAPQRETPVVHLPPTGVHGIGNASDAYLSRLLQLEDSHDWASVEELIADAIRSSGANIVTSSRNKESGADLAVWTDLLDSLVGNPLLIEIKRSLRTGVAAQEAIRQVGADLASANNRWALLLYAEGPDHLPQRWFSPHHNVLALSIRAFLESLRSQSFPELIRDLRNQRVHGVDS
jgi:hypothetical protein